SSGFKIDTSEEISQSIKLKGNINGWESFQKKDNDASIILGIGSRFLLSIDGENQENCNFIKNIATSMNLEKLNNLD
ncbi:MAG: hypothetical protein HRT73_06910, partial [Flavobacteriales bacterium]|nr:hypothetical protein [Flavobacteriales bacterium]